MFSYLTSLYLLMGKDSAWKSWKVCYRSPQHRGSYGEERQEGEGIKSKKQSPWKQVTTPKLHLVPITAGWAVAWGLKEKSPWQFHSPGSIPDLSDVNPSVLPPHHGAPREKRRHLAVKMQVFYWSKMKTSSSENACIQLLKNEDI